MSTSELMRIIMADVESVVNDYESVSPDAVSKITRLLENFTNDIDNIMFYDSETERK